MFLMYLPSLGSWENEIFTSLKWSLCEEGCANRNRSFRLLAEKNLTFMPHLFSEAMKNVFRALESFSQLFSIVYSPKFLWIALKIIFQPIFVVSTPLYNLILVCNACQTMSEWNKKPLVKVLWGSIDNCFEVTFDWRKDEKIRPLHRMFLFSKFLPLHITLSIGYIAWAFKQE